MPDPDPDPRVGHQRGAAPGQGNITISQRGVAKARDSHLAKEPHPPAGGRIAVVPQEYGTVGLHVDGQQAGRGNSRLEPSDSASPRHVIVHVATGEQGTTRPEKWVPELPVGIGARHEELPLLERTSPRLHPSGIPAHRDAGPRPQLAPSAGFGGEPQVGLDIVARSRAESCSAVPVFDSAAPAEPSEKGPATPALLRAKPGLRLNGAAAIP